MQTVSAGWERKPVVISNEVVSVDVIEKVTFEQRHDKGENQLCSYPRVSILGRGNSQYQNSRRGFPWLSSERAEELACPEWS